MRSRIVGIMCLGALMVACVGGSGAHTASPGPRPLAGAPAEASAQVEAEVKAVVEAFLAAAGAQRIDDLAKFFAPGASIGSASLRNGVWVTATLSADAWIAAQRTAPPGRRYEEPVHHFTVIVDDDRLAYVRAAATLKRDGQARSLNTDYFVLVRDGGGSWRIINGSYTTKPAVPAP